MKPKAILKEGTWSAPQTHEQARELADLFRKPMKARTATGQLYDLIGDDDLYDQIEDVKKEEGPNADVRWVVAGKLDDWISRIDFRKKASFHSYVKGHDENFGWSNPWDPEAIGILKRLVKRYSSK